ncbi:MAG: peptidase M48 Ste24p [Alphaproteobacteria bacterium]|nr:MAG: peptidase M48 Ste24p [Alphaproteobacteria bacterium]
MRARILAPILFLATAGAAQAPGLSDSDRAAGARANPQLTAEFGGAYTGPQAAYVRAVGQRIAAQSGLAARAGDYTVTLLNSNANNAFAIPGGYVYVTRQLVALMNDEAELAFVMGHEVGHVAARHSQKRQQTSGLASVLAGLAGAVTGSSIVGQLAGTGAQMYTLGYSRDQERQADTLGVRYLAGAGYDPAAGADILAALGAQTALEARLAGKSPSERAGWTSTHPATGERVQRVRREAAAMAARSSARAVNRDAFLDAIDGMIYDDDPSQGVVRGGSFRHPALGIAFDAPAGFALQNSMAQVTGSRAGAGQFSFAGGRGGDLAAHSDKVWQNAGAAPQPVRNLRINGLDAAISQTRATTRSGSVDATLVAYRWAPDRIYHLLMIAPAGGGSVFEPLIGSVRRLAPGEAGDIRPRRIAVVTVGAGDTVQSLSRRMAYDDDRLARFTVLNGLAADSRLTPGTRVKLVVQ